MATWHDPVPAQHRQGFKDLNSEPADEFLRYRALVARVVDSFGDEIKASRWLSLPNNDLNGLTPLEAARRGGYDLRIIEPILTRIEHGVDY